MNVAELIEREATKSPHHPAIIFPQGEKTFSYTYEELIKKSCFLSYAFQSSGIKKGDRILFFVKPSLHFSAIAFSLFKLGAIPVFIDPGMGLSNLLRCVRKTKPSYFISERKGIILKWIFRKTFSSLKKTFCTKSFFFYDSIEKILKEEKSGPILFPKVSETDKASLIYTSGGTGSPKGVWYDHGMFRAQVELLKSEFSYTSSDKDLPGFPLFSMMTIAMGVTSVIPEMDPSSPGTCDPSKIVKNIEEFKVTTIAGSPAIWERVGNYCQEKGITLESVRALIMFGAPIPKRLHKIFEDILPNGTSYTPYGATECLPVSNISWKTIQEASLPETFPYNAICIGKNIEPCQVRIIQETNKKNLSLSETKELPSYEIGEIIAKGRQASPAYLGEYEANEESKIKDQNSFWHKMGDLGFKDAEGKLWFCGRKAHKVTSSSTGKDYFSLPTELLFNDHPEIKKTALIKLRCGNKIEPALSIERLQQEEKLSPEAAKSFKKELLSRAAQGGHNEISKFFLHKSLPVDRRHNIKIDRKALSEHFSQNPGSFL